MSSTTTPATASVYSATKASVDAVTKSLAKASSDSAWITGETLHIAGGI